MVNNDNDNKEVSTMQLDPHAEAFRKHYEDDDSHWGKNSGGGSNPYHTVEYRCFLDKFIGMNKVNSIVDIGCGDWQFSQFLNLNNINYLGLDVVPSVIKKNSDKFSSKNIKFSLMCDDLIQVPSADLLIMKDVLQHLPNKNITDFANIVFPKFKFCLLTNSFNKLNSLSNIEIKHGEFRTLDLSAPPYSLKGSYVLEFSSPLWERIRTYLLIKS
jgi:2-polyprenyl-3-methyl-5-hydroxy-6-metoxy-1,4-benzoquinol methylase